MPTLPSVTADQVPPEWIANVREIVRRDGIAISADSSHLYGKSLTTNQWCKIMLPGSCFLFATERDALTVYNSIVAP